MSTVYGGTTAASRGVTGQTSAKLFSRWPKANTVFGGVDAKASPVLVRVIDPKTRQQMSVMYNSRTRLYLDAQAKTWKPAPAWMVSQIK